MRFAGFGGVVTAATLSACSDFGQVEPYPLLSHPCELFETTDYMRQYWLGIRDGNCPDVRVQVPSRYIDFRLRYSAEPARNDGAIGLFIRPLDFGPSQSFTTGPKDYPGGPPDPSRPLYKTFAGSLLLTRHPPGVRARQIEPILREYSPVIPDQAARDRGWVGDGALDLDALVRGSTPSEEAPGLRRIDDDLLEYSGHEDYFVRVEGGEVLDYVYCTSRSRERSGEAMNAQCGFYTKVEVRGVPPHDQPEVHLDTRLDAKLRFDRDFLPEWARLRADMQTLVDCMVLEVADVLEVEGEVEP